MPRRLPSLRRTIQGLSFLLFLWLFLYVCWPYQVSPGRTWSGWMPEEVDAVSGEIRLTTEHPPPGPPARDATVYVVDGAGEGSADLGGFRVVEAQLRQLRLRPVGTLPAAKLEELSAGFGPWTLAEKDPRQWPSHYADGLRAREAVPAELFLAIDPLVGISTAIAARTWVWPLAAAAGMLLACVLVPRGFCSYLCPLGTIIDLVDGTVWRRVRRSRPAARGWWAHLKYYLLAAVLAASLAGVLVSGFVAAIPVVTRALAFLVTPLELGLVRGWHQVPAWQPGHYLSAGLFAAVLGLGLLGPRFWCRYVCPSGALFSLANVLRISERKVSAACIECGKCARVCPFDAVRDDFTTRTADCTLCRTCGGVCPTEAIRFGRRWRREGLRPPKEPSEEPAKDRPGDEALRDRRRVLAAAVGLAAGAAGGAAAAWATRALGAGTLGAGALGAPPGGPRFAPVVRPPGAVPEAEFLRLCIRCGECYQACPNNVLQPLWLQLGPDGLWTPAVAADWSGCEPSCNNCGQVCPTGAIRALPLEEKRAARIGLAIVDPHACLPYAGRGDCQLCADECKAAGYRAIEFVRVGTVSDADGRPIPDTGFLAPVVLADECVGCGLCQTRCRAVNVKQKSLLTESAIRVVAGEGREDRLAAGSYAALRRARRDRQGQGEAPQLPSSSGGRSEYLPDSME